MSSGAEAALQVETDRINAENRRAKLISESKRTAEEASFLQKYIYDNANPNPVLLVGLIVLVLAVIYILYIYFVKPDATGEWRDTDNNKLNVSHSKFKGCLNITVNGTQKIKGNVADNMVKVGNRIGLWNYTDTIAFLDGSILRKVRG